jgi:hypothetical protein
VILHGRSLPRIQQAQSEIAHEVPGARLETAAADFSALAEVRDPVMLPQGFDL